MAEYWLFDPQRETARIYRRRIQGRLGFVAELSATGEDVLHSPLFPGLGIPLREVFE